MPYESEIPFRWSLSTLFRLVENAFYLTLGGMLAIAAAMSLCSAGTELWAALRDWDAEDAVFAVIDRLLFVFMLLEILNTIRNSLESRRLHAEPFLVVALIASVRRVLVITLQSAGEGHDIEWTPQHEVAFRATMTELAVLALLILVMVASIIMLRRSPRRVEPGREPIGPLLKQVRPAG